MAATRRKFLIIDDHVENRFLLTRTVGRKFPAADVRECGDIETAIAIASTEAIDAVISHRVDLTDGIGVIRELRRVSPDIPIIMVSSYDRTREALAAGATRFLLYDEWLRVGEVTQEVLETQPYASRISALTFAIERRFIVTFSCATDSGQTRTYEIEPHLVGETSEGKLVVWGDTVAGGTRHPSRNVGWHTYLLENIKSLAVTERLFAPHPAEADPASNVRRVFCEIAGTASGFIPRPARR